jgi:hypothetical protein
MDCWPPQRDRSLDALCHRHRTFLQVAFIPIFLQVAGTPHIPPLAVRFRSARWGIGLWDDIRIRLHTCPIQFINNFPSTCGAPSSVGILRAC